MICKWCGAAITAGGKKCARCGREIPAMSDCGGFYDLVPNPGGAAIPVAAPAAPVAPPPPSPEELARRAAAKKKAEQMALIRLGIFALVALVIVIMLIVIMVRLSGIDKRLDAVEQDAPLLDSKLSAHLQEQEPEPESPFQDMDGLPQDKPDMKPGKQEDDIQDLPVETPQEPEALTSWGFQVSELANNGRSFVKGMEDPSTIELLLERNLQWTEEGICFVDLSTADDPGQIVVVPMEQDGIYSLEIRLSGGLVHNYKEFRDEQENDAGEMEPVIAECTPDGEGVTVTDCQLTEAEDGVIYTMEVSEALYRLFADAVEDKESMAMACAFTVEKRDGDQTIRVTFQPDAPETDGAPEIGAPNEGFIGPNGGIIEPGQPNEMPTPPEAGDVEDPGEGNGIDNITIF